MDDKDRPVRRSAFGGPSAGAGAAACMAKILGMAGYSIVAALLPQFIDAWSLTNGKKAYSVGMVFAGYKWACCRRLAGIACNGSRGHIKVGSRHGGAHSRT